MSAPSARPSPRAATIGRTLFRVPRTVLKPSFSLPPSRFCSGTTQSSKARASLSGRRERPSSRRGGRRRSRASSGGHDEAGDAVASGRRIRLGEHRHVVGDAAAGDERLLAVDHVALVVLDGARLRWPRVGAGVGLGEAVGGLDLARGDAAAGTSSSAPPSRRGRWAAWAGAVRRSMSPDEQQYLATSSTARASARKPAPLPPYSSGIVSPRRPGIAEDFEDVLRVFLFRVDLGCPRRHVVPSRCDARFAVSGGVLPLSWKSGIAPSLRRIRSVRRV